MCREYEKRIEPAPGLVDTLRDKVGRERILEQLLVFKRIVKLSVRHAGNEFRDVGNGAGQTDLPDSNQQSKTSSTRRSTPLPCEDAMVIPSTDSL